MDSQSQKDKDIPLHITLPTIVLFMGIELVVITGLMTNSPQVDGLISALMLITPWLGLRIASLKIGVLGYERTQFGLHLGWGFVVGGIWRIASMTINLWASELSGVAAPTFQLLALLFWVPFIEETFFRGFIGQSLSSHWGSFAGILVQAAIFTLLPSHMEQGGWNLLSIFAFGILAGWLMQRRKSIWAPWGAHAFANLLPLLVQIIY